MLLHITDDTRGIRRIEGDVQVIVSLQRDGRFGLDIVAGRRVNAVYMLMDEHKLLNRALPQALAEAQELAAAAEMKAQEEGA